MSSQSVLLLQLTDINDRRLSALDLSKGQFSWTWYLILKTPRFPVAL